MSMRLDAIDDTLGLIIDKTSAAVDKMATMEREQEEKKNIMDDVFDPNKSDEEIMEMVEESK